VRGFGISAVALGDAICEHQGLLHASSFIHMCVCVFVCVRARTRMHACMHACAHLSLFACMLARA